MRYSRPLRNTSQGGFTLLELIVVIVVAASLAAVAIPSFKAVTTKTGERSALIEARELGREALDIAAFDSRELLTIDDFLSGDLDRSMSGVQLAMDRSYIDDETSPFWLYTSERGVNVRIYSDGSVVLGESGNGPITIADQSVSVHCIGSGVTTCTDNRAMYVRWRTTSQSSARVTLTPSTSRGTIFETTADANRELYVGLGTPGEVYTATVTVYQDNNFTNVISTVSTNYTVPAA